ncbi:MAG: ABC transporter permease [Actinomycetota bacterium]
MLTLFAWPQARFEPRDLPLGIAGPPQATALLEARLAEAGDAFEVHRYADEASARAAIEDREVYGAIAASRTGVTLLTASAGSPAVAGLLQEQFAAATPGGEGGSSQQAVAEVVDVVPADPDDPRGAALSASVLPLLLAGIITGALVATITAPGLVQLGALLAASALAGLAAVAIAQGWLGVIEGSWVANAGVLSLTVLAVALVVAGLVALLGLPGIGVAAVLMVLIGNPWSGIGSAPELLPRPIGGIGQLFPPGAGGNALRSTAFFDCARAGGHVAVLIVWAVLGLVAMGAGAHRKQRATGEAASR